MVHAHNFVDPANSVHTQEAESAWNNLKIRVKNQRGIEAKDLQANLGDRIVRQWRGRESVILNFLPVLASQLGPDMSDM